MTTETTLLVSLAGSLLVASIPKLIDLLMGDRINRRKAYEDREDAYKKAVFDDAAAVRMERANFQISLEKRLAEAEARCRELEEEIRRSRSAGGPGPADRQRPPADAPS